MVTEWCTKLEVTQKTCPIVFQGHTSHCKVIRLQKSSILTQIRRFRTVTPVWIHQWLRNDAKFEATKKRCPIVFEGHLSNLKVIRLQKSSILTQIRRFRTVTPVWIHQWLRNDAKFEATKKRCPIVFEGHLSNLKVTRLKKIVDFDPNLGSSDCNSSLFTNGYQMIHKAWSNIEKVPYCLWRSYV